MFGTVAGELVHFARVGAKAAFNFARTPLVSVFSSKGASMPATRAAMGAVVLLFPAVKLFRGQGLYHMWHMGTGGKQQLGPFSAVNTSDIPKPSRAKSKH